MSHIILVLSEDVGDIRPHGSDCGVGHGSYENLPTAGTLLRDSWHSQNGVLGLRLLPECLCLESFLLPI